MVLEVHFYDRKGRSNCGLRITPRHNERYAFVVDEFKSTYVYADVQTTTLVMLRMPSNRLREVRILESDFDTLKMYFSESKYGSLRHLDLTQLTSSAINLPIEKETEKKHHNHGPDKGLGTNCPEEFVDGELKGLCLRLPAAYQAKVHSDAMEFFSGGMGFPSASISPSEARARLGLPPQEDVFNVYLTLDKVKLTEIPEFIRTLTSVGQCVDMASQVVLEDKEHAEVNAEVRGVPSGQISSIFHAARSASKTYSFDVKESDSDAS